MSKAPAWLSAAETNTTGNEVGQAAQVNGKAPRGKPGPKKSAIKRKVVGLNFSDTENQILDQLEMKLKLHGVALSRGRSEAAMIAIERLLSQIDSWSQETIDLFVDQANRDAEEKERFQGLD